MKSMAPSTMWSLLLVAVVVLTVIVPVTHQQQNGQYSWMPQGRFGKRTKDPVSAATTGADRGRQTLWNVMRSSSQSYSDLPKIDLDAGSLRYADVPVIESDTDGIVCLMTDYVGYYRCFRDVKPASSSGASGSPDHDSVVAGLQ